MDRLRIGSPAAPLHQMQAFYFDTVASTNDLAKSMLRDGRISGAAFVVAREQTAGRGNRGRTWLSPRDAGIYLTVIDRPQLAGTEGLQDFTRAAAIACAEVLEASAGIAVKLKPINDLYVEGRKLGGILTEAVIERTEVRALITGVGINVRIADRPLPPDEARPVCIEELTSAGVLASMDIRQLTVRLVERIQQWNAIVAQENGDMLEVQWRTYCMEPAATPAREA